MRRAVCFLVLAAVGCGGDPEGGSLDLASLRIYAVKANTPEENPYDGVEFLRFAVEEGDEIVSETFVHYQPGGSKGIEKLPFGKDLRFVVEGWTQDAATGKIGTLVSRGRSMRVDLTSDSDPVDVNVMFSKVNEFAFTTASGSGGLFATSMTQGRVGHSVTALQDGRVLIAGGARLASGKADMTSADDLTEIYSNAEIYDPATGIFTPVTQAMAHPRAYHTATLMPDGTVLIAGGLTDIGGSKQTLDAMQVFDPATGAFSPVLPSHLSVSRAGHTATALDGAGHVLFAGGFSRDQNGQVTSTGNLEVLTPSGQVQTLAWLQKARAFHTATMAPLFADKRQAVLLAGGENEEGAVDTVEIYLLNTASSQATLDAQPVPMPGGARTRHTATFIESQGFVHIVGGFHDKAHTDAIAKIDSFKVIDKTFQGGEFDLLQARGAHVAVPLPGNAILIAGGSASGQALGSAEVIFEFFNPEDNKIYIDRGGVRAMHQPRVGALGLRLPNDVALIVGGAGGDGTPVTAGEFFNPL